MPKIRVITLDWGDTLAANVGMPYLTTQRRAFSNLAGDLRSLGGTVSDGFTQRCLDELAVQWKTSIDPTRNPEHKEFDFAAMLAEWATGSGVTLAAALPAINRCTDTLTDTVVVFAETAPALRRLREQGLRLGILSHVPWPGDACRRWFARHGLAGLVDFYSLSSEIGWIKPNPRHFQHAVTLAGCSPGEILHVGDHPDRDIAGARLAGLRTCLRHTEGIYQSIAQADAEILHLSELPGVVERLNHLP
ncbi:hypothetical protein LBMAG53_15480 [Planctomycetota bacterium]|nr:hypothetical protein LBMAG53_15480 [Planctomycetota bacterium]